MTCSVVIPCHNGVELTRACVDSLLAQDPLPLEILIVDNGSSDDTSKLGSRHPIVRVLPQHDNLGFAGGVNAGVRAARGETVLILNNDTRAASNLIRELQQVLHGDAGIGAVAPVSNHVKGEARLPLGESGRDHDERERIASELAAATPLQDVETLAGLCLLMRRATFREVGMFDERFGHGNFEDDDLSLRLRLAGHRLVIARRAFLHHEGHATFRSLGLDLQHELERRHQQFRDKWQHHPAGLATLARMQHNPALTLHSAERARRRSPRWLDADLHAGRVHEHHGDAAAAVRHLQAFLRHCPEHVGARFALACALLRDGDRAAGYRWFDSTLQRHQATTEQLRDALQRFGQIEYESGRADDASHHFRMALELAPECAELHNWLGLCLMAAGNHRDAQSAFTAAIDRGFALAHTNLGICQHRCGQLADARANFERAVVLLPNDPVARANYESVATIA